MTGLADEAATTLLRVEHPARVGEGPGVHPVVQHQRSSYRSERGTKPRDEWRETPIVAHHQERSRRPLVGRAELLELIVRRTERLFHEDRLAAAERFLHQPGVLAVPRGDDDEVGVFAERVPDVGCAALESESPAGVPRAQALRRDDRYPAEPLHLREGREQGVASIVACPEDADPHLTMPPADGRDAAFHTLALR